MAQLDLLSDLTDLRLSDNDFEEIEMTFEHLPRLERVHLNGNRLRGRLPELNLRASDVSSYVSDCRSSSDFGQLVCEDCSLCCE